MDIDIEMNDKANKTKFTLALINRTLSFKESSTAYTNESDVIGIMCAASNHLIGRCDRHSLPDTVVDIKKMVKYAVININSVLTDAENLELKAELTAFNKLYKHWLPLKKHKNELVGVILFVDDSVELKSYLENNKLSRCAMFFSTTTSINAIFDSLTSKNENSNDASGEISE